MRRLPRSLFWIVLADASQERRQCLFARRPTRRSHGARGVFLSWSNDCRIEGLLLVRPRKYWTQDERHRPVRGTKFARSASRISRGCEIIFWGSVFRPKLCSRLLHQMIRWSDEPREFVATPWAVFIVDVFQEFPFAAQSPLLLPTSLQGTGRWKRLVFQCLHQSVDLFLGCSHCIFPGRCYQEKGVGLIARSAAR